MKYGVEYKNGKFVETLEVDGCIAHKTWKREDCGEINGLCTKDADFAEQFEELLDEEVLDSISNFFDDNMLVADVEDFVCMNDVE